MARYNNLKAALHDGRLEACEYRPVIGELAPAPYGDLIHPIEVVDILAALREKSRR
jgi:hypothetical protein